MPEFLHHNLQYPVTDAMAGAVIAIGNFDGVHRGHQVVLQTALEHAERLKKPCFALSFEPHPRTLFNPDSPVFRLSDEHMKARILSAFGLSGLLVLPFTRELAGTDAREFVERFLLQQGRASHIVTGFNFHFGKNRSGTPEFLLESGKKLGFGVTIVDAISGLGGSDQAEEPISSSRIRHYLGSGETKLATDLLGYRWIVSGEVIKGAQLGRTLNYPTANLSLPEHCRLAHGIYAVRLRRADGSLHNGVASYGRRPTFDNGPALLETFVFDFNEDLYDEVIEVSLFDYLRGEEKFASTEELVAQMDLDSKNAMDVLATAKPLSQLDRCLNFDGLV